MDQVAWGILCAIVVGAAIPTWLIAAVPRKSDPKNVEQGISAREARVTRYLTYWFAALVLYFVAAYLDGALHI